MTMIFPHYFHLLGYRIHPHPLMEVIAYAGGFQLYLRFKNRWPRARIPIEQNLWIIVGAIFGALFGSKILAWLESAPDYWPHRHDPAVWLDGKTIVGGLLGGWIGVEVAKKIQRIRHSTGDAFVFPLIFGMAVGRIGCFLTGVSDHTHGNATALPWGIDMGDGIRRHPTQLYDIVFLILFGTFLAWAGKFALPNGRLFRLFLLGYVAWRFGVEFIKPRYTFAGLSAIQMACGVGAVVLLIQLSRHLPPPMEPIHA
ncbi:MAG TPA: prolipoprotein diacylglyceryl transferase family protein [Tepidisphaeraceae bacterium]|jgi:prolipoprotein diacylglyceryltransferase|nr:prolipoprotein diacylglyceryl transferase family protein [Tepidisphaeraceae bacterium]